MSKGIYTPDEVSASYRQAKDKNKQIDVLAELQGCSRKEIEELLRERGETLPEAGSRRRSNHGPNFTPEEDDQLRELIADGWEADRIGERIGRSPNSVISRAYKLGLKPRTARSKTPEKIEVTEPGIIVDKTGDNEKPVEVEKPRIVLSPTRPMSFDDRIEAVRFLSALMGSAPSECQIAGELITLKFRDGMCQLHACRWDNEVSV